MKTNMVKDLKYLSYKNSFLIGNDPLKGETIDGNVFLFGDCAIRSSKNTIRRKLKKSKKKTSTKTEKATKTKEQKPKKTKSFFVPVQYFGLLSI